MIDTFQSICDSFYINLRLGTQMGMPHNRETLLHFFEQMQKAFPDLTRFRRTSQQGEGGQPEFAMEEDRDGEAYRWVSVEQTRLSAGHVNPPSIAEAMRLHTTVLDRAPHALGLSMVEIDYIDILLGFDLDYAGNHDAIIAESLFADSPLAGLLDEPGARAMDFQPTCTVSLSEDSRLQARIDVVTRSSPTSRRATEFNDESISVYFILRRYFGDRRKEPLDELLGQMIEQAVDIGGRWVVPKVVAPIRAAIGSRP